MIRNYETTHKGYKFQCSEATAISGDGSSQSHMLFIRHNGKQIHTTQGAIFPAFDKAVEILISLNVPKDVEGE